MPTFEERLTLIEYEHAQLKNENAELKKAIELQTIAIGALVNKEHTARFDRLETMLAQVLARLPEQP